MAVPATGVNADLGSARGVVAQLVLAKLKADQMFKGSGGHGIPVLTTGGPPPRTVGEPADGDDLGHRRPHRGGQRVPLGDVPDAGVLVEGLDRRAEEQDLAALALDEPQHAAHEATDVHDEARAFVDEVIPAQEKLRAAADELETLVPDDLWPLPKYRELLFQY